MRRFTQPIKQSIITGVVILIPAVVAVYIAYSAFVWVDGLLPTLLGVTLPPGVGVAGILLIALVTGLIEVKMSTELVMKAIVSAGIVSSAKTDTRRVERSLPDLVAQWYRNARRDPRVFRHDPRDCPPPFLSDPRV